MTEKSLEIQISIDYHTLGDPVLVKIIFADSAIDSRH